jgi:hypothetical protein
MPTPLSVLIVGEKYRHVADELEQTPRFSSMFITEDEYDWRYHSFYLNFDVVICPYRLQLLHLAFERAQRGIPRPYLMLATGARAYTDRLVAGGVCDFVAADTTLELLPLLRRVEKPSRRRGEKESPIPEPLLHIARNKSPEVQAATTPSHEAVLDFLTYLRARHRSHDVADWYSLSKADAARQMNAYYEKEVGRAVRNQGLMYVKPVFGAVDTHPGTEMHTAFMLMPFAPPLTDFYNDVIVPTLNEVDVKVRRADDFATVGELVKDIWRRINDADFIIADLTTRNPNVFYELGMAHTVGKPVILLAQSVADIPFDVHDQRAIVYDTSYKGIDAFKTKLQATVSTLRGEDPPKSRKRLAGRARMRPHTTE